MRGLGLRTAPAAAACAAVLSLLGCASPAVPPTGGSDTSAATFELEIQAPSAVEPLLSRHMELQRFRTLSDLAPSELERLIAAAPADARQLLATQGYFAPTVNVSRTDETPPRVRLTVDTGPRTAIASVALSLEGDDSPDTTARLIALREGWTLPVGAPFTQAVWDNAKQQALRSLQSRDFPRARIADSRADIDPTASAAHLHLRLASGPAVRLGEPQVSGAERYAPEQAVRIARQAGLRPGIPYDDAVLQGAQRALVESGYYDAAFVRLADEGDADAHPVLLQVREAPRQRLAVGLGASTDEGGRLSLEHTHHRVPGLDWRAQSRLQLTRDTRTLGTDWTSPLGDDGWRHRAGLLWERVLDNATVTATQQLRLVREKPGTALDRTLFVQFDRSSEAASGATPERATGLSIGTGWTRRAFDDADDPTEGHGLAAELGVGWTLTPERKPYARARLRWRGLWPLPGPEGPASRLVFGVDGGVVWAAPDTPVPAGQRFLAGGDGSVRGYAPRSLGVPSADGRVDAGRLMLLASAEWQRPLVIGGTRGPWELALFADAGAVADRWRSLEPVLGVGGGVRYRSPVGPLRADLAYGVEARRWRLHVSVGFAF